jgi:tRNA (adenine57-N1/adenine58-N1)-methyltransferase
MTDETLSHAQAGDLAQLVSAQNKRFTIRLTPDGQMHTHRGILSHNDLIGLPWGSQIKSHLGSQFILIQPTLSDILLDIKRNTQIMYPKEIGFILVNMGIGPGKRVLEAGTGSGSLTTALAYMVGDTGRVISYETRPEMQRLAIKNLERVGLSERVTFKLGDIRDGFEENNIDALFLDVPNPFDYLAQVRAALKPGCPFGTILPTTNQISSLLIALKREHFAFIEVCEILLRFYKAVPERLRPTDRMVAHTGYLIFARPIIPLDDEIEPEIDPNMDELDPSDTIVPGSDL